MPSFNLRHSLSLLLLLALPAVAVAQPGPVLRLRSGAFVPPADVRTDAARQARRARVAERRIGDPDARTQHLILQFDGPLTQQDFAELRRAGATPLRYVPDHALAVAAPLDFDPAGVRRVRWAGELTARDRLSAAARRDLERDRPGHAFAFVQFHPDVALGEAWRRLQAAGAAIIPRGGLPASLALVAFERTAVEALADDDAVAWIYPAAADEPASRAPVCQGAATAQGLVAEYALVGDGWDGPGAGAADLGWHVQASTPQVAAATAQREILRALDEWSRHIQVTWRPVSSPHATRALTILWGQGEHGDGYPFSTEVLAHAFYQAPVSPEPIAGDVHFNDGFEWGAGLASRYDIFSVMLHETGHSLGLGHSGDPEDVMYPVYRGIVPGLAAGDVAAARQLYAATGGLPGGWSGEAIGSGVTARATEAGGVFRLEASGRDVWGTADEFGFISQPLDGDGDIVARLDSLAAVDRWTKAGVMIRAEASGGSAHAFVLVSGERGLAFQRRRVAGGTSIHTDGGAGTAPRWIWLSRRGDRFDAYAAVDGGGWRLIGSDTIPMPRRVLAGLALSSHLAGVTAAGAFSNVSVRAAAAWSSADIGAVGRPGSLTVTGDQVRVTGAGADIWGTADAFHFAWRELQGDGEIVARVASLQYTHHWAKAGVMIRGSLDAGAPHAFMLVSADRGVAFQRRTALGGPSTHTDGGAGRAPQWVRLRRQGQTFTAWRSADGTNWIQVGTDTIPMAQTVLVGLAVTSHTTSATGLAVFEHIAVR